MTKREISGALFNILYHKDLQERKSPSNKSRLVIFWGSTLQRTVWSQRDFTAFLCRAWGERRERHVGPRTFRSRTLWRRSGFWFLRRERRSCRFRSDRIKAVIETLVKLIWLCFWGWYYYPGIIGIIQKNPWSKRIPFNQPVKPMECHVQVLIASGWHDAALGGESHHKETRIQTPRLP